MKQVKTSKVSGGDYAKVADRLKEFRQDNPRSSIKTTYEFTPNGGAVFTTYILKDKRDKYSADATGTAAYSVNQMKKDKAFEKLETISVGRALSLLGYLNNGEIASTEEMEEFETFQDTKKAEEELRDCKTLDELKEKYTEIVKANPKLSRELVGVKDEIKAKLGGDK